MESSPTLFGWLINCSESFDWKFLPNKVKRYTRNGGTSPFVAIHHYKQFGTTNWSNRTIDASCTGICYEWCNVNNTTLLVDAKRRSKFASNSFVRADHVSAKYSQKVETFAEIHHKIGRQHLIKRQARTLFPTAVERPHIPDNSGVIMRVSMSQPSHHTSSSRPPTTENILVALHTSTPMWCYTVQPIILTHCAWQSITIFPLCFYQWRYLLLA